MNVDVEGEWCLVEGNLNKGDVVGVTKNSFSSDESLQVPLFRDLRGIVKIKLVDEDGDIQVIFPNLEGVRSKVRWVLKANSKNLLIWKNLVSGAEAPALTLTQDD